MRTISQVHQKILKVTFLAVLLTSLKLLAPGLSQVSTAAAIPPQTPVNFAVSGQSTTSISLSWALGGTSVGVKNYTIYRNGTKLITTTGLKYTNTGLKPATTYRYRILETDKNSVNSVESQSVYGLTRANPPTLIHITNIGQNNVSLGWTASTNSAALTGYYIYRNGTIIGSTNNKTTVYTDTNLASATTYTYAVKGYVSTPPLTTTSSNIVTAKTKGLTGTPIILSNCADISHPGTYILNADIYTASTAQCFNIHDTNNVIFDCQNHQISSNHVNIITINSINTFSIINCSLSTSADPSTEIYGINISNSQAGTVMNNSFSGSFILNTLTTDHLTIKDNIFNNAQFYGKSGTNDYVGFNNLQWIGNAGASLVDVYNGSNNTIDTNTINGEGGGVNNVNQYGFDDGINVQYENSDLLTNNTIMNIFDCGIETVGPISNTVFRNNNISNATYCGIGGWYWNSWLGNTVSGNTVNNSQYLFRFMRYYGLQPSEQYMYFENNNFINNSFVNPNPPNQISSWIDIVTGSPVPASQTVVGNNTFTGNNFGNIISPPLFDPALMIVDGGSNTCAPYPSSNPGPLTCQQN